MVAAITSDDLALAAACLDVETALLAHEMASLERLLGMLPSVDGYLGDRVFALDDAGFASAVRAMIALSWITRRDDYSSA